MSTKQVAIRLPIDMLNHISQIMQVGNRTRTQVVIDLLNKGIQNAPQPKSTLQVVKSAYDTKLGYNDLKAKYDKLLQERTGTDHPFAKKIQTEGIELVTKDGNVKITNLNQLLDALQNSQV